MIVRLAYFFAAFVPAHLLVAVAAMRDGSRSVLTLAILAIALGLIANAAVLWRLLRRSDGIYADISTVQEDNGNVSFYIFSVIPIFLASSFVDGYQVAIFCILYFCVIVVAVTTKIIYANPILFLLGVRFFKAEIIYNGESLVVEILSKRDKLFPGKRILLARLGRQNLYVNGEQ